MKSWRPRNSIIRPDGTAQDRGTGQAQPGSQLTPASDDSAFIEHLTRVASAAQPERTQPARAALLSAVADAHEQSRTQERPSMLSRLLTARALAALAAAGIFAGGAATVGAAGGVSGVAGNVSDVLQTLHITDRTPDQADTHIEDAGSHASATKTPEASDLQGKDGGLSNAEQHADDNAAHGLQNAQEGSDNAGEGIQNASPNGLDHANSHATDGPSNGDRTPEAESTEASDNAGTPEALPTEASDNASERGDNALPLPTEASGHAPDEGGSSGN